MFSRRLYAFLSDYLEFFLKDDDILTIDVVISIFGH